MYLLRSDETDDGGPVKSGEVRNLIAAGYYGWDSPEHRWGRKPEYKWYVYNRQKKERIDIANTHTYEWKAPAYDSSSDAANTYCITCMVSVKLWKGEKVKTFKEGITWVLWVQKP